jgi:hypothetical protein
VIVTSSQPNATGRLLATAAKNFFSEFALKKNNCGNSADRVLGLRLSSAV